MRHINVADVPVEYRHSPRGTYEVFRQHVSLALGGLKDVGPWGGGLPFDVEFATLPPGKRNYPLHSHAAQTEHYIVVAGRGRAIDGQGRTFRLAPGDHLVARPGEAHLIEADEHSELQYFVIADHHPAEVTTYPNTGKRHLKPEGRVVHPQDTDYYAGEE
jgi:uncharacterized cupin superfamily protein